MNCMWVFFFVINRVCISKKISCLSLDVWVLLMFDIDVFQGIICSAEMLSKNNFTQFYNYIRIYFLFKGVFDIEYLLF